MDAEIYKKIIEELIKLVDEGVYVVDQDGVGMFYNEKMASIEQINVEDVVGKEFHKAFPGVKLNESTLFQALKKMWRQEISSRRIKTCMGRKLLQ